MRYNRSCDGRGGKHSRNRRYAPTGPLQTLQRQAQRLNRFGGRALRSGRPDADEEDEVVGGFVGGRLKVTCRSHPRCFGGGAWPGDACATGQPLRGSLAGSVSAGVRPLSGGVWTPCRFYPPSRGGRSVLTTPALGRGRLRWATAVAAHRPGGPGRSGPAEVLQEV